MDFSIERDTRLTYLCPHTPRALKRLANWGASARGFPFPKEELSIFVSHLVEQGFQVQFILGAYR